MDTTTPRPELLTQLLRATGPALRAALTGASLQELATALRTLGSDGIERRDLIEAAHEQREREPAPAPYLPTRDAEEFASANDRPRLRAQIERARVLRLFHTLDGRDTNGSCAVETAETLAMAERAFRSDVLLGLWLWDTAWEFDRLPWPWSKVYLREAFTRAFVAGGGRNAPLVVGQRVTCSGIRGRVIETFGNGLGYRVRFDNGTERDAPRLALAPLREASPHPF